MNSPPARAPIIFNGCYWLIIYAALWWLLSGGEGWGFGAVNVLAASALSLWLGVMPLRLRLFYLPQFLVFFIYEVFAGAWDVARRALHPHIPLDPAWVNYQFRCENARVRLLLSAMVGLLPGTLATHFDNETLYLHVLDQGQEWRGTVAQLKLHLARLTGATIQ